MPAGVGRYAFPNDLREAAVKGGLTTGVLPAPATGDPPVWAHRVHLAGLAHWYLGSLYRVNLPLALPAVVRNRYHAGVEPDVQGFSNRPEGEVR
ncbi:hypothetical protein [Streptomyces alkaliphilus]|uniref:hypothetical protein n=1 Tax=Streptomyces alkaliphilus TaxID=1472722 RepID=UPI001181397A|nr:hypothetical protein [Streptomyces alkaliphilus]MQS09815.1 hypothetical protein [Streptomyces alkaliphilus]